MVGCSRLEVNRERECECETGETGELVSNES